MKYKINQAILEDFANLSRDYNPIHLDSNYAKKSFFGNQIIYGIYQVFLCLEYFFTTNKNTNLLGLKAQFLKPIFKDTMFNITINKIKQSDTMGGGCPIILAFSLAKERL